MGSQSASCNTGDTATGGGYALNSESATTVKVGDSRPNPTTGTPTGWYAEYTSWGSGGGTMDVWATCEHIT